MNKFPDIRDIPDGLDEGLHGVLSDIKECLEVILSRRSSYLPEEDYDPVNKSYIDLPIGIEKTEAKLYGGLGSPEGEVLAQKGSIYLRTDGGANTSIYIKESGVEKTGWTAK